MNNLHQILSSHRQEWSRGSYSCTDYPAITEILEYQIELETGTPVALRKWETLNPERFKYHIIFTGTETVGVD
jgi:hypothetical protein